jgi:hypothetical protein
MTKQKRAATKPTRRAKTVKLTPKAGTAANTKLGQLEAMLRRPNGATIKQLTDALDWQAHSVRGAMSGSLKKKQGLKITAAKAEGQERTY